MSPRIRSFFSRPPYARETKSPAREAPRVFREFVETLQRLDPPGRAAEGAGAAMSKNQRPEAAPVRKRGYGRRPRRQLGNGHARPRRYGRKRD